MILIFNKYDFKNGFSNKKLINGPKIHDLGLDND